MYLFGKEFRLGRNSPIVSDIIIACTVPMDMYDLAHVPSARPNPWCCQAIIRACPFAEVAEVLYVLLEPEKDK